jgi:hypothetical protein
VRYNEILFFAQGYALAAFLFVLAMGAHLFHSELTDAGSWVLARSGPVLQTGFVVAIIFLTLQVRSAKLQPFIYFQF